MKTSPVYFIINSPFFKWSILNNPYPKQVGKLEIPIAHLFKKLKNSKILKVQIFVTFYCCKKIEEF